MNYSFTKAKIKPVLSLFATIWIIFYALAGFIIISLYIFIFSSYLLSSNELKSKKQEVIEMNQKIKQNNAAYDLLNTRLALALKLEDENEKTKLIIKNIFDFVINSGTIKLEAILMDKDFLELRGITPTKETFTLLIQTPLKSIFDESLVSFYPLENGWFRFVNTNKIMSGNDDER